MGIRFGWFGFCVLFHGAVSVSGQAITCDADNFCSMVNQNIQTPVNNSGIRTSCTYSNQNQTGLTCATVSFHVLFEASQSVSFFPSSNLLADSSRTCTTPPAFGSSACGIGDTLNVIDPNGNSFRAVPFAVKPAPNIPASLFGSSSTTSVCFKLIGSASQRCLYIFINVAPSAPLESITQKSEFSVNIGYELVMKLTSSQTVDTDQVDIILSADSAELPGSQWNGQTVCIGPNLGKCPSTGSDNWGRSLTYVPRPEENGNIYTLYLQSVTKSTPRQPQGYFSIFPLH